MTMFISYKASISYQWDQNYCKGLHIVWRVRSTNFVGNIALSGAYR